MKYNRNYGKLNENGTLVYAPIPLVIDGVNFWTNDAQKYLEHGYFPIEHTDEPVKEGFYYTLEHEQQENKIVEKWIEHEESNEISGDEFLSIVERAL